MRKKKTHPPRSRFVVKQGNYRFDIWLDAVQAKAAYQRGEISMDLTNSKGSVIVYCSNKGSYLPPKNLDRFLSE